MARHDPDRRRFLVRCGQWMGLCAALPVTLAACSGDDGRKEAQQLLTNRPSGPVDPCDDPAVLDDDARITRMTFKYESRTADPARSCAVCRFWEVPREGEPCGGCTLVKGPIHPLGTCASWAQAPQT